VAYFLRRVHEPAGAEDLAHEVFIRLAGVPLERLRWADAYIFQVAANILLVVAPSQSIDDLMAANLTAAQQAGVVSISNSRGCVESVTDVPTRPAADHILKLATQGTAAMDPPLIDGFIQGSDGGVSSDYALPPFQAFLRRRGTRRLVPDISWVADPFTGVKVVVTVSSQGGESIGLDGGTSVATPMFSALWTVAVQEARRPLGQAALRLYSLPPWSITDVGASLHCSPLSTSCRPRSRPGSCSRSGPNANCTRGRDGIQPTGLGTPNGPAFVNALSLR
jgi:hypothetical protein